MATSLRHLLPKRAVLVTHTAVCHKHSTEIIQTENNFPTYDTTPDLAVTQCTARKARLTIHCVSFCALTEFCHALFLPTFVHDGVFLNYCRALFLVFLRFTLFKTWEVLKNFLRLGI